MSAPVHPEPDCGVLADALAPGAGGPEAPAPPGATRLPRLLAAGESLFVRADAHLARHLTPDENPLARLGPLANAALALAVVSGVLLLVWYSPSVQSAWSSLAALGPRSPGGIVRSVHRHSSDLAMLLLILHALRTFVGRKFAGPRWLAWSSGVALLALVGFIGWTGYWLVWDVRAQWVALESMKLLDVLPVFGEPLGRLFTTDRTVPSLLFFVVFFLHLLLPLAVAAGLALHLARLSRSRLLPDRAVLAWVTGAVVVAALVLPASSAEPARMAVKPEAFTLDWWYLWPLAVTTRLTGGGAWLAGGLAFAAAAAVPWWLGRRRPRTAFQARVDPARCFACTQCAQDCPFGAIAMVPRTDGRPWPAQAQVDPDRCVGCGVCTGSCDTQAIGLPWFDARRVAPALRAEVAAAAAAGRPPAVALVCAQADGGWDVFQAHAWRARLPGYEVRPVPSAGWVEPKVVEGLIAQGARAVLVVSTVNADPHCREGDAWLPLRLRGEREPEFRPTRADPRKVAHVRFDPTRPGELAAAAQRLLRQEPPPAPVRSGASRRVLAGAALTAAVLALALAAGDAPFRHPTAAQPELVLTFRAFGDWVDAAAVGAGAPADRPVHMRAATRANRTRQPVVVQLAIDGKEEEFAFRPKGLQSDGASTGVLRRPLAPGRHRVALGLATGPGPGAARTEWTAEVTAEPGRLTVVSFEPGRGFLLEPAVPGAGKASPPDSR